MRTIYPQQLVILKNGYQIGRESHMGISVVAGFYLSKPDHFVTSPQIWHALQTAPRSFQMLDCAEPKPFAEYLLAGHAGIGEEVRTLDVQVKVGSLSRRWRIEGESHKAGIQTKPFNRMPMDHTQSWGGKGCKENPLGRGYSDSSNPTLMSIGFDGAAIVRSPLAAPTPIPHDFQLRKTYLDNVSSSMKDKRYLETYFPGLPPGIDHRYFQLAPPSQWLNTAEWPDSVPYELQGFRPNGAVLAGSFPAVRARAFIWLQNESLSQELPLQRKTLWLLPDQDVGLLVFTGNVPLTHLFDEPVKTLLVGLDGVQSLREAEHYQQVYARRSVTGAQGFAFLNDQELMPVDMPLNVIRDLADHPYSKRYQATPQPAEVSQRFYQEIREAIEQNQQQQQPELPQSVQAPPATDGEAGTLWLQRNEDSAENLTFSGTDFSALTLQNRRFRYCTFNHCRFLGTTLADCTFESCQFIYSQIEEAQWRNVHLIGCFINHTVFRNTHLDHCLYEKVTMESAQFLQCRFTDFRWQHCTVKHGDFTRSQFEQCTLDGSFFSETLFNQSQHNGCLLTSCIFEQCSGLEAKFVDSTLEKSSFIDSNWRGISFTRCQIYSFTTGLGVDLSESRFEQCSMEKVGFTKANLQASTFSHCSLLEGCCDKANLDQATITSCDMASLRLKDACLTRSLWQATSLQQSMLYNADLRDTCFQHCNLIGASLAMTSQNLATRFEQCLLEKTHWLPRRYKVPA
jgi:uncharacterized protein YjbI with pentapeptide repeats